MGTTNLTGGGGMDRLAYGVHEAARLLGVSAGLLRLEITRGHLNPLRVGRRIVLSRTELDAYLARNRIERPRHQPARPGARNHGERV